LSKVYAFCRFIDNVADEDVPEEDAREILTQTQKDLRTRTPGKGSCPAVEFYLELHRDLDLRIQPALDLIEGVLADLGTVRIRSKKDLIKYCYRVAGTVGLMIVDVLELDSGSDSHAVALGVAMQLSNIVRDVREDFDEDRIYLPDEIVRHDHFPRALNRKNTESLETIQEGRKSLVERAHSYYSYADEGIHYIPFQARVGIYVARYCYEAIGYGSLRQKPNEPSKTMPLSNTRLILTSLFAVLRVIFRPELNGLNPSKDNTLPQKQVIRNEIRKPE